MFTRVENIIFRFRNNLASVAICLVVSGCGDSFDHLPSLTANPNATPARNFTSFTAPLQCMDRMLAVATKNKRPVRLSSTGVPDHTNDVDVGSDDMLVSALNQMNRISRSYVFLDQTLVRDGGLLELEVNDIRAKNKPPMPDFYIRGAITQLDDGSRSVDWDGDTSPVRKEYGVTSATPKISRGSSIVTVDLHLVAFPSRQIVPGGSVSNSMVVSRRGFSSGLTGEIVKAGLGFDLEIERVESTGQAVRNLIELSLLELIGRHSGIAYWDCLALEPSNTRHIEQAERKFERMGTEEQIMETQALLLRIGAISQEPTGQMDLNTKRALAIFQANNGLIANGTLNFDTIEKLRSEAARAPAPIPTMPLAQRKRSGVLRPVPVTPIPVQPNPNTPYRYRPPDDDGYQSMSQYLTGSTVVQE